MKHKHSPAKPLTIESVLTHIRIRLKTLGDKTHGPQYHEVDRLRASHGIRELMKLEKWLMNHTESGD
jgi:hypothetical protein